MGGTRRGFTLVELLVVIAIIGILIALLLPAIQAAREAARRSQCANNLKQIGLGVINYESNNRVFPPGNIALPTTAGAPPTSGQTARTGICWTISILPYMEQPDLFKRYKSDSDNANGANNYVRQTPLNCYSCPSDTEMGRLDQPAEGSCKTNAMPSSYRGMAGRMSDTADDMFENSNAKTPSTLHLEMRGPLHTVGMNDWDCEGTRDIRDGTSNTLLVGEATSRTKLEYRPFWGTAWGFINLGSAFPESRTLLGYKSDNTANPMCADITTGVGGSEPCKRGWGSAHAKGLHFVQCDGSVKYYSSDMDMTIFVGMATVEGGETVVAPD